MRMHSAIWARAVVMLLVVCGLSGVRGQTPDEAKTEPQEQPQAEEKIESDAPKKAKQPPKPRTPMRGPQYLNLRWDEDFSYLDGEEGTYRSDLWDPIKNIKLGEDWRLTIGGSVRFRWESERNRAFGAVDPARDSYFLHQWMLHADLKYRRSFRVFVEGISAFIEDRDRAARPIDENRWDLHQLFADVRLLGEDKPLTLRVGRQELLYGNQRLVSPLAWANVRRRFDGVKLFAEGKTWDVDLWWARPVVVEPKNGDSWNQDYDFWGAYSTYKGIKNHGLDLYFFATHDDRTPTSPNLKAADRSFYTLGARFWGETGPWDYETELSGQWGKWGGDTMQSWAFALYGGYTFETTAWKPRLGAGFDLATGDNDPTDSSVQTFDQLFPLGHAWLGYLDLVGRKNINAVNVNLTAWPVPKKLRGAVAYHAFWLNEKKDALYNAGGGVTRRDLTGDSGRDVGHELDLTLLWRIDAHSSALFGYSHFWGDSFISDTGPNEDASLFYIQYLYKF